MMQREQRAPMTSRSPHITKDPMMKEAAPSTTTVITQPPRHFWRRFVQSSRRFRRKARDGGDEDTKSQYSSSSSSQSGSDDSEHSSGREQRVVKYLPMDTACHFHHRPISLIANEGDLTFHPRDDINDFDDDLDNYLLDDQPRDDVSLLRDDILFQSHLLHTPKGFREPPPESEDRVALLSEHDDLVVHCRRGSYNVDSVESETISEPAALQKLSLLSLEQELASQEENIQWNFRFPSFPHQQQPSDHKVLWESTECKVNQQCPQKQALVPLQIDFPSGKTTGGDTHSATSQSPANNKTTLEKASCHAKEEEPAGNEEPGKDTITSELDPLDAETSAYSEIISDRTQKHKAFYLLRLRNSQKKKNNSVPRPAVHGDLWTLPELPSDEECSRFSNSVSETRSIASRLRRSGSWSSDVTRNKQIVPEDQVALISAI